MIIAVCLTSNSSINNSKETFGRNNNVITTNNLHDPDHIQSNTLQDNGINEFTKRNKKKKKKYHRFPWCFFRKKSRKDSIEPIVEPEQRIYIFTQQQAGNQVNFQAQEQPLVYEESPEENELQELPFPPKYLGKPLWFSNHGHWEDQEEEQNNDGITGYSSPRTTTGCFHFFRSSNYTSSEEDGITGYSTPGCFSFRRSKNSDSDSQDYKFIRKNKNKKRDYQRKSNIRSPDLRPSNNKNSKRVRFSTLTRLSTSSQSSDDSSKWVEEVRRKSIKHKSSKVKIIVSMADDDDTDAGRLRQDPGLVNYDTNTGNDDGIPRPEAEDDEVSRIPVKKKIQDLNSFFQKSREGEPPIKACPPSSYQGIRSKSSATQSPKPALLPKPRVGQTLVNKSGEKSPPVIHSSDVSFEVLDQEDQKIPIKPQIRKKGVVFNNNWNQSNTTTNNRMLVDELKARFQGSLKSTNNASTDQSNNNSSNKSNTLSFSAQSSESSCSPSSSLPSSTTSSFRDPANNASSAIMQVKSRISQQQQEKKKSRLHKNDSFHSSSSSTTDPDNLPVDEEDEDQTQQPQETSNQSQDLVNNNNHVVVVLNDQAFHETEDVEDLVIKEFLEKCDKSVRKLYYIAREVCSSERVFVNVLNLLNVDFRKEVAEKHLPTELASLILRHMHELTSISSHLLSELEDALKKWPETRKLSHVFVKVGPFLKVFSTYMQDFDSINDDFDDVVKRSFSFASALKDFESSPRCKKLTIKHYLLKPVQRIPQYRLLLEDYLKHMTPEDPDFDDTVKALAIVTSAAEHANNAVKTTDSTMKLLTLQNSLIRPHEIIKPGRTFLKEGELLKVSRKELQPRNFVLCSDCLFYLSIVQAGLFHLHHEMSLTGMRVTLPKQEDYKNEFTIISAKRSLIVQASSDKERKDWFTALTKAIEENSKRRRTFMGLNNSEVARRNSMVDEATLSSSPSRMSVHSNKSVRNSSSSITDLHENNLPVSRQETVADGDQVFTLGEEYPVWIPDERVTMCQVCTTEFSLTFRRHHCRACGKVVCNECSANRVPLKYLGYTKSRVCDDCRDKLRSRMKEKKEKRKSVVSMGELSVPNPESDVDYEGVSPAASPYSTVHRSYSRNPSKIDFDPQFSVTGDNKDFCEDDDDDNVDYDLLMNQFERVSVRQSNRKIKPVSNILKVSLKLLENESHVDLLTHLLNQVSANDLVAVMRGYLLFRKKTNSWKKHWFVIKDKVLYFYKASEDVVALQTEVLLGWDVMSCTDSVDGYDCETLFKISHTGRPTYHFKAESIESKDRWLKALKDASVLTWTFVTNNLCALNLIVISYRIVNYLLFTMSLQTLCIKLCLSVILKGKRNYFIHV